VVSPVNPLVNIFLSGKIPQRRKYPKKYLPMDNFEVFIPV